jgi:hypothetical protein
MLSLVVLASAVGCGPTVSGSQDVSLKITETSFSKPIRMSIVMDGANIFGPLAMIEPGETKTFTLSGPNGNTQMPGLHTILYTFDRVGLPGEVGNASIQLLTGDDVLCEDNSSKVLTGFAPTYSFQFVVRMPKN